MYTCSWSARGTVHTRDLSLALVSQQQVYNKLDKLDRLLIDLSSQQTVVTTQCYTNKKSLSKLNNK